MTGKEYITEMIRKIALLLMAMVLVLAFAANGWCPNAPSIPSLWRANSDGSISPVGNGAGSPSAAGYVYMMSASTGSPLNSSAETPIYQHYCKDSNGLTVLCEQATLQMTTNTSGSVNTILKFYVDHDGMLQSVGSTDTTVPTISSGFGTSPSVVNSMGPSAFTLNVGTGGTATSGVIGLPTAPNGWYCSCSDLTTTSATDFLCKQTATTRDTATIGEYDDTATAAAWTASDILQVSCKRY